MVALIAGITSACTEQTFYKPKPAGLTRPPADAPENYLAGWNDGCDTGLSTMVTTYYKTFYTYTMNHEMISDTEYYKAWKDAYHYCRQYSFRYIWDGFDRMDNKIMDTPLCVFCN